MEIDAKPIGTFLEEAGIITSKQIDVALAVQKSTKGYLGEILQDLDFVTSQEIAKAIAKQRGLSFIEIEDTPIDTKALAMIPKAVALNKKILPIRIKDEHLIVAASEINDITTSDYIAQQTGLKTAYQVCDRQKLAMMIELHYYQLENPIEKRIERLLEEDEPDVVHLIDLIIQNAIKDRATDIHFTPDAQVVHVFFRIDGVLKHYYALHKELHANIVARIKIVSNLDIAEQRLPQDGSFMQTFLDQEYDLRVSTMLTDRGENVVLRILSRSSSLFNLDELGLKADEKVALKQMVNRPYGMVLVTGPTGSGKTTTLYASLRQIDTLEKNVLTVEDPIEYRFAFAKQTQINEKSGFTFSKAIRHFMRQDPDVMLIGEIRDSETAELAVRASITGHLVLSTLHTNSAIETITRLLDMGISSDLIATALHAVVAQRLVRKVCPKCAKSTSISGDRLGLNKTESYSVKIAQGCEFCHGTGYFGRVAIVEMMRIDEGLKELIAQGKPTFDLIHYAQSIGFKSMRSVAVEKVIEQITTLEEIDRVTL